MIAAVDSDAAKFSMLWFDLSCAPPASVVDVAVVEDVEDVETSDMAQSGRGRGRGGSRMW
jgi:hypothetical protein